MIIPFFIPHAGCPHQCVFCDQKNITGRRTAPEPSSLPSIISSYLASTKEAGPAEVAFYGGTFTSLTSEVQRAYLTPVQPFIDTGTIAGIRLSTRPDAVTADILSLLKRYRVSTVELGVQSMDDDVLRLSGRGHTAEDTARAVDLPREHAFKIGLQLMPGLPGDTPHRFRRTVTQVIELRPDLVRIYPALVIKDTPLAERYRTGSYAPLSLDDAVELCREAADLFTAASITVARVGLQPTEELERPGTVLAGPWHPAFGQLVASSRFFVKMRALLPPAAVPGPVHFAVHPADRSSAVGQDRRNIRMLREQFGRDAVVVADPDMPRGAVRSVTACNGDEDELP